MAKNSKKKKEKRKEENQGAGSIRAQIQKPNESLSDNVPCFDPLYLEERRLLQAGAEANGERFDKYIISLSGGGLAVSAIFVKDFITTEAPTAQCLMVISWILFVASIAISLICTYMCQRSREEYRDDLDAAHKKDGATWILEAYRLQAERTLPRKIELLNKINLGVFLVAGGLLGIFVALNI